jgi:hypothetical protein
MSTKRKPQAPAAPPEPMTPERALRRAWNVCRMHEDDAIRQMRNRCEATKESMDEFITKLGREDPVFNSLGLLQCSGELDFMAGRLRQIKEQKRSIRAIAEAMGIPLEEAAS